MTPTREESPKLVSAAPAMRAVERAWAAPQEETAAHGGDSSEAAMKYYATHLTAAELSVLEEATTAALEQLGRSSVSDPHGYADAAISEDLMDALLDQIYDAADEAGPDEQHTVLVLTEDLRDVARALLTAAASAYGERSSEAQDDRRTAEAALLLAQCALARQVELRLTVAAIAREEEST